jgi:SAM-dependent methyltransferase
MKQEQAAGLDPSDVHRLRTSWEAMMRSYLPDRQEMLTAGMDAAEHRLGRAPASVLDVGGGPGTTAEAVLHRWPQAAVTVLDVDPTLLALAQVALPETTVRRADLRTAAWQAAAGEPHDLVLLVMTLHYLPRHRAAQLYGEIRELVTPGGALLVLDTVRTHRTPPQPEPEPEPAGDSWSRWWQDLLTNPRLQGLAQERRVACDGMTSAEFTAPLRWHRRIASAAGFDSCDVVWHRGRHAALVSQVHIRT